MKHRCLVGWMVGWIHGWIGEWNVHGSEHLRFGCTQTPINPSRGRG